MSDFAFSYLRLSNVSRSHSYLKGSSAVAAAAYILCTCMQDERTGVLCDWSKKSELIASNTKLPESCSPEYKEKMEKDPELLWNEVEKNEKSVTSRTAKEIVIGLPIESEEHWEEMARDMTHYFTSIGHAVTWAIHDKIDGNPHLHMCVSSRQIEKDRWLNCKYKKVYALDENGERIPIIDPATGVQKVDGRNRKQWKRVNESINHLDKKDFCREVKAKWSEIANRYLQNAQVDFSHYREEGYISQIHQGNAATEIKRKGTVTRIEKTSDNIRNYNQLLQLIVILEREIATERQILLMIREQIRSIRRRIIAFISKVMGWNETIVNNYEEGIEKAEDGLKPETKLEKLVANNIRHGINPIDRFKENISIAVMPEKITSITRRI